MQKVLTPGLNYHKRVDLLKSFTGIFPVYKPAGVCMWDIHDWLRLTLEFEFGVKLRSVSHTLGYFPLLTIPFEGFTNYALGSKNKWISGFKHVKHTYEFQAKMGFRKAEFIRDGVENRPYDHVTHPNLTQALESFMGEKVQTPGPRIAPERTVITEFKWEKKAAVRNADNYEGTQPRKVTLYEVSNVTLDPPYFGARIVTCGIFCLFRYVDEVSQKLGTNALLVNPKLVAFDEITIDDALQKHQLYLNDVQESIEKHKDIYSRIVRFVSEKDVDFSSKHRSPWK